MSLKRVPAPICLALAASVCFYAGRVSVAPHPVVVAAEDPAPSARINGDVNCNGSVDLSDAIYILNWLFMGAARPCPMGLPPVVEEELDACRRTRPLPATGQTICYDGAGHEISCDDDRFPGQDAQVGSGCPWSGRFVDHGDGTVTDTCTGLMWQKTTPDRPMDWESALDSASSASVGGHRDWRVPNVREMLSLYRFSAGPPHADPVFQGPVVVYPGGYWTSTTEVLLPKNAYVVRFVTPDRPIGFDQKWETDKFVRLVRDAE